MLGGVEAGAGLLGQSPAIRFAYSYMRSLYVLRNQHLDQRLSRHTYALCLSIQGMDHPYGKIDIHPLLFSAWAFSLAEVHLVG